MMNAEGSALSNVVETLAILRAWMPSGNVDPAELHPLWSCGHTWVSGSWSLGSHWSALIAYPKGPRALLDAIVNSRFGVVIEFFLGRPLQD